MHINITKCLCSLVCCFPSARWWWTSSDTFFHFVCLFLLVVRMKQLDALALAAHLAHQLYLLVVLPLFLHFHRLPLWQWVLLLYLPLSSQLHCFLTLSKAQAGFLLQFPQNLPIQFFLLLLSKLPVQPFHFLQCHLLSLLLLPHPPWLLLLYIPSPVRLEIQLQVNLIINGLCSYIVWVWFIHVLCVVWHFIGDDNLTEDVPCGKQFSWSSSNTFNYFLHMPQIYKTNAV